MLDKLEAIKAKYDQLSVALSNPEIVSDNKKFTQLSKEYRSLEKIVNIRNEYSTVLDDIEFNKEVLNSDDEEMRDMAKIELPGLTEKKEKLEKQIRNLLIPKDPQDEKNCILEIRAGTGGDEASLFAGDLFRMYLKYCERKGWKTFLLSESEGTVGGYKEIQLEVIGDDVYGTLKFESGVHRVQRVPDTEGSGRVHTSAATVAVMPEAEEVDVEVKESDVKMETARSGGAGGQRIVAASRSWRRRSSVSTRALRSSSGARTRRRSRARCSRTIATSTGCASVRASSRSSSSSTACSEARGSPASPAWRTAGASAARRSRSRRSGRPSKSSTASPHRMTSMRNTASMPRSA